jgi:hypothetical protein
MQPVKAVIALEMHSKKPANRPIGLVTPLIRPVAVLANRLTDKTEAIAMRPTATLAAISQIVHVEIAMKRMIGTKTMIAAIVSMHVVTTGSWIVTTAAMTELTADTARIVNVRALAATSPASASRLARRAIGSW